jgi:hypothetical protein
MYQQYAHLHSKLKDAINVYLKLKTSKKQCKKRASAQKENLSPSKSIKVYKIYGSFIKNQVVTMTPVSNRSKPR